MQRGHHLLFIIFLWYLLRVRRLVLGLGTAAIRLDVLRGEPNLCVLAALVLWGLLFLFLLLLRWLVHYFLEYIYRFVDF